MKISHDNVITPQTRLQRWLKIGLENRKHVYSLVYADAEISSASYWLEIVFSAGIAAFGLVLNSPAVIPGRSKR